MTYQIIKVLVSTKLVTKFVSWSLMK